MTLRTYIIGLSLLLLASCSQSRLALVKPDIDVEIVNVSSHDLSNAKVHFGENVCGWGWVGKAATKGFGFYPHPITAQAELHWDEAGRHRVEKLDLGKIYPPGRSGRLTFTVKDGGVAVSFQERSGSR